MKHMPAFSTFLMCISELVNKILVFLLFFWLFPFSYNEFGRIGSNNVTPSRVTVIVAYMMKTHGMSVFEALEHVGSTRPAACPNQT